MESRFEIGKTDGRYIHGLVLTHYHYNMYSLDWIGDIKRSYSV